MQCDLCAMASDTVVDAGVCLNKCHVSAHPECLAQALRKKKAQRDNAASDVCPMVGCLAKFKPRPQPLSQFHLAVRASARTEAAPAFALDDPSRPCGFLGRNGLPCKRAAVANGACKLHARDAAVTKRLAPQSGMEHAGVQVAPDVTSRGVQTVPEEDMDAMRAALAEARSNEAQLRAKLRTFHDRHEATLEAEKHATRLEMRYRLLRAFDDMVV